MSAKPEFVVFYAWQSDRPGSHNRYFIQEAATKAAAQLNSNPQTPFHVRIDQDTQGVPGLCDIPATIIAKIEAADGFLCDLTYVAESVPDLGPEGDDEFEPRLCSNPNVLFELGFAFRAIGPERVLCVMNEKYGPATEQIFDLAHRRHPLKYFLPDPTRSRSQVFSEFVVSLKAAIVALFPLGRRADVGDDTRIERIRDDFEARVRKQSFHGITRRHGALTIAIIPSQSVRLSHEEIHRHVILPPGRGGGNTEIRGNSALLICQNGNERTGISELRTDGVILAADTWMLDPTFHENKKLMVPSLGVEGGIIDSVLQYLELFLKLKVQTPWTICISMLQMKDYFFYASNRQTTWQTFAETDIRIEPIVVSKIEGNIDRQWVASQLRPAIDFIWREFGFSGSWSFTAKGAYNNRF